MAGDSEISEGDLPPHVRSFSGGGGNNSLEIPDEGLSLEDVEKKLIQNALNKAGGNKSKAAKLLGITRRKLYSMMERLG
jgi:transcriptional regulator with PAS, ATPase and Fis domain